MKATQAVLGGRGRSAAAKHELRPIKKKTRPQKRAVRGSLGVCLETISEFDGRAVSLVRAGAGFRLLAVFEKGHKQHRFVALVPCARQA